MILTKCEAGDITYISMGQGWMYLAVVLGLNSRKVVGWALADNLRAGLVTDALQQALTSRRPPRGLIFRCFGFASLQRGSLAAGCLPSVGCNRGSQYGGREHFFRPGSKCWQARLFRVKEGK